MSKLSDLAKKISQPAPDSKEAAIAALREAAVVDEGDIPAFLKRESTPEALAVLEKRRAIEKRRRSNPGAVIKDPPNRVSESARMLGMSPAQLRSTGAALKSDQQESTMSKKSKSKASKSRKPAKAAKAPKAPKVAKPASTGERARYPWGEAEETAKAGRVPAVPDFSAPTHARFLPILKEVTDAAKAKDVAALRKIKIATISSSPKAIDRYRKLCITALTATPAPAAKATAKAAPAATSAPKPAEPAKAPEPKAPAGEAPKAA